MKDTGAFVSVLSSDTELGEDDQYVCVVQAQFENRNVEFKAFYTMDPTEPELKSVSLTFSPQYTVRREHGQGRHEYLTRHGYRIPGTDLHQHPDQLLQVHQRLREQMKRQKERSTGSSTSTCGSTGSRRGRPAADAASGTGGCHHCSDRSSNRRIRQTRKYPLQTCTGRKMEKIDKI